MIRNNLSVTQHSKKISVGLGLSLIAFVSALAPSVSAASGTTSVTALLSPGILALTTTPTTALTGLTLNGGSSQTASGSLGLITITDARGVGSGWSLTATTTALTRVGLPVQTVGPLGVITTGGTYTGTASGTYTVTIANAGTLGTATYAVSGLETQAATTTGTGVALGTRGLNLSFAIGSYTVGEQWTIDVGVIPASNLTITPSAAIAVSGNPAGVTAGGSYTYTTGSDPATIVTSSAGAGLGIYTDTPTLSLAIPSGVKSGTYAATVTETVN